VDIELPPELERLQLRDLHKNYRFDIRTSHLVRKSGDEV
jgi:hypothetical protein